MPGLKSKKSKNISYLLRFTIAGAAIYLAFRGENVKQVIGVLLGMNPWVFIAALGIYIISQLVFVARWYLILRSQSIEIGFWPAVRLHFLGLFYNNCLPGSVGGDLLRAWYVTKYTDKKVEAALTVFIDRIVGFTGIFIMTFFCFFFLPEDGGNEQFNTNLISFNLIRHLIRYRRVLAGFGLAFVVFIAVLMANVKSRSLAYQYMQSVRKRGAVVLSKVRDAIRIYYHKKLVLFNALLLTFCCQGIFILALLMIGFSLGINAPVKYYFIFFPVSWLLGLLPISVGGAGIMEWWLKVMFVRFCAVSGEHALVLALCQRLLWLLGSLPGVAIHLMGAHLPKDFFIDYDKSLN